MTVNDRRRQQLESSGYEIFIGILALLSIFNMVLILTVDDKSLDVVLYVMNGLLSALFLLDFSYRMRIAESKRQYFFHEFGWADLLASLPIPQAKLLRIFRLVRVRRTLGEFGTRRVFRALLRDRAESALLTLLLLGILVLEFGSLLILRIEQYATGANITTASDALWYVVVTISTVGYGDEYPVTSAGRVVGSMIIVVGVGIFGTFTGFLANFFLSPPAPPETDTASKDGVEPTAEQQVSTRVAELRQLMAAQQAAIAEIDRLLEADGR